MTAPLRARRGDDSYAEFVRAGLGPTVLARFHGPMADQAVGSAGDRPFVELARRRIAVNDGVGLLRRIARGSRPAGRTFLYPRLGYGEVVDRLAEAAARRRRRRSDTGARRSAGSAGPRRRGSTLDDGRAIEAGTGCCGRHRWRRWRRSSTGACRRRRSSHRGLVLVYLVVDEDRYSDVDAHYVPDADVAFARLSEPKNYRAGPDPAGRTVLCAEVPATVGDARVDGRATSELGDLVLDGMARIGLRRPTTERRRRCAGCRGCTRCSASATTGGGASLAWADGLAGVAVLGRQGAARRRQPAPRPGHGADRGRLPAATTAGTQRGWAPSGARFDAFVVDD